MRVKKASELCQRLRGSISRERSAVADDFDGLIAISGSATEVALNLDGTAGTGGEGFVLFGELNFDLSFVLGVFLATHVNFSCLSMVYVIPRCGSKSGLGRRFAGFPEFPQGADVSELPETRSVKISKYRKGCQRDWRISQWSCEKGGRFRVYAEFHLPGFQIGQGCDGDFPSSRNLKGAGDFTGVDLSVRVDMTWPTLVQNTYPEKGRC